MNNFDLHMHSMFSIDGEYSLQQLIDLAKQKEIKTIALSDHNTIVAVNDMIQLGKENGIEVIPAVECSTEFHGNDTHVLGYGIDLNSPYFLNLPNKIEENTKKYQQITFDLYEKLYDIQLDRKAILEKPSPYWFNFAEALFNIPKLQILPEFKEYIPGGKKDTPGPVNFFWDQCQKGSKLYIEPLNPTLKDTVDEIHKAGGIAILAHPYKNFYQHYEYLQELINLGIDGIEAYSTYHTMEQNLFYEQYALEHNLLITCGSDFHGKVKPNIDMKGYQINKDASHYLHELKRALQMKKTKLVLCDIDGTLYNWTRKLSPKTIEIINRLHAQGYEFGLASGRPLDELSKYANEWKFDYQFDAIVGLNGAEIWDCHHDTIQELFKLSADTLKEIFICMDQFECNPMLYRDHKIYTLEYNKMIEKSAKSSNKEVVVTTKDVLYQYDNAKVMFRMSEEELKRAEQYFEIHPSSKYIALKTQSTLLEFMDPRISKGLALNKLCESNEYNLENVLAFGDTTNDNSMLSIAGWSVCLLNGSDDTKAIAHDITETVCEQDGFANYIEKYLLK